MICMEKGLPLALESSLSFNFVVSIIVVLLRK